MELIWDDVAARGDWRVNGGRLATGNLLVTAVLISLFTDRVAQVGYKAEDGSNDRHGWWNDTFDGVPIGSRLWQLRRRKIANRPALIAEATDMVREALQWMITGGIAATVDVSVTSPPAGIGQSGTMLAFAVTLVQPSGNAPVIRALWSTVGRATQPIASAPVYAGQLVLNPDGSQALGPDGAPLMVH